MAGSGLPASASARNLTDSDARAFLLGSHTFGSKILVAIPQVAGERVRRQGLKCDVGLPQGPQRGAGVEARSEVLIAGRLEETLQLPSLEVPRALRGTLAVFSMWPSRGSAVPIPCHN